MPKGRSVVGTNSKTRGFRERRDYNWSVCAGRCALVDENGRKKAQKGAKRRKKGTKRHKKDTFRLQAASVFS